MQCNTDQSLVMDNADGLTSQDLYIYNTANYARAAVVLVGLSLMVFALYRIYVYYRHIQEHGELMKEYQEAKFGLAANLRQKLIAIREEGDVQNMRLEENERTIHQRQRELREQETRHLEREREFERENKKNRENIEQLEGEVLSLGRKTKELGSMVEKQHQMMKEQKIAHEEAHKKEMRDLKAKYLDRERDLQATMHETEKQTREHLERQKQNYETRLRQLQTEVLSLKRETKALKSNLEKEQQVTEEQVQVYEALNVQYSTEIRRRVEIENEKCQLEDMLHNKVEENMQLQKELKELRKQKEEQRKGVFGRVYSLITKQETPHSNNATSQDNVNGHEPVHHLSQQPNATKLAMTDADMSSSDEDFCHGHASGYDGVDHKLPQRAGQQNTDYYEQ